MRRTHIVSDRYLWNRPQSRSIWFRMAVPKEYQARAGRKVVQQSLGTTDRREASILAGRLRADLFAEWRDVNEANKAGGAITPGNVALEVYNNLLDRLEAQRRAAPIDDDGQDREIARREADLRRLTRRRIDGDLTAWETLAAKKIESRRLPIKLGSEGHRALAEILADASIDSLSVFTRRHAGELDAAPRNAVVVAERSRQAETAKPGETILELYDAYAVWKADPQQEKARRAASLAKCRPVVELFAEFVGEDRAVASITARDARAFRDMLREMPASRGKIPSLARASIADCVAIANRKGLKLISLKTQAKYISIVASLFAWIRSDGPGDIAVGHDLFAGLHPKPKKGIDRRPSFDGAQLNRLIRSPLFGRCGGAGKEHMLGDVAVRDHRYWIPLLCLFTGSRVTEIAQLHVDDVTIEENVPLILIKHDERSGRHTKGKRNRIAALHQHLIDAGFLEFWRAQLQRAELDGNRQLFIALKVRADDPLGAASSRWFGRYLTRIGIKDGADGYGVHSFRHTMADAMRAAGFIDVEFGQLVLGHSNNTITSAYGSLPQGIPARLKAMVDAAFCAKPYVEVAFGALREHPVEESIACIG